MISFGILASANLGYLLYTSRKLGREEKPFGGHRDTEALQQSFHESEFSTEYNNTETSLKPESDQELDKKEKQSMTRGRDPETIAPYLCPDIPPNLGPVTFANTFDVDFRKDNKGDLRAGGFYKSRKCSALQNAAIIVPFSGTRLELIAFANFIHPFLMRQQLEYQLFIVEHNDTSVPFSVGKLLNIGYLEALKTNKRWLCIILHTAHLIPMDTRNLYRCAWQPAQLVNWLHYNGLLYNFPASSLGVVAVTTDLYGTVNGFPNTFEDNTNEFLEFVRRLVDVGVLDSEAIETKSSYSVYRSLKNLTITPIMLKKSMENITNAPLRFVYTQLPEFVPYSNTTHSNQSFDGLTSLNYELSGIEYYKMYTHIGVSKVWLTKSNDAIIAFMKRYLKGP
ncbi:beta-1,4-galactosyltransferase 2-like [Hyposmocoma kahamanoa]|uniref:beta-1,4-galactosyltransferase 2-like n=1 Tax=Hyposmocoma kahamanoa TaxID=1477025 RepID=UPI000E6D9FA3|nr:beta-1,4-galactosyltransferase 2-like [Hyposmocoma kahamanoa]